jgi:RNA polymerase sigma factor (sigma-70 family)
LTQAEQFLLDGIRRGDGGAWEQFVDRFRGRLLAFAARRLPSAADAEDALQDTFVRFLRALPTYRGTAAPETYLFTILRRRIVDHYRGRGRSSVCLLHDVMGEGRGESEPPSGLSSFASSDPTASFHARQNEHDELRREALAEGVRELVDSLREDLNFRDLKVVELLFYCQLANKNVASVAGADEKHVALVKHRAIKRIRQRVQRELKAAGLRAEEAETLGSDAMLTGVWESLRLSCPKRSTIGAFVLGSLERAWADYVDFHLNRLGCQFCLANLEDLKRATEDAPAASAARRKILQSTVGFLRKA